MNSLEQYYFTEEHQMFRKTLRDFLQKEVLPNVDQWEEDGQLPKDIFLKVGEMGFFGMTHEEKYGGSNLDFWYDVIYIEEIGRCESGGFGASISAHPYLSMSHLKYEGSDFIKQKYLTKAIKGEWRGALAISEPHAGSDVAGIKTTAVKQNDHYIINGSKCFITNGVTADYMVVACKTKPDAGASGISMIVVDADAPGIMKTNLKKLGWKASDTAEIAFDNVKVPSENLLGDENKGFYYIMQRFELERLTLALGALSASEYALEYTLQYMNERKAFGRTINKFQVLRHRIAQLYAEVTSVKTYTYHICRMYNDKHYCVKEASMSKLLATELSDKVMTECLQMFGGYGYMEEYKMARMFRDSRLGPIGGGSSEIMREIISKIVIDDVSYSPRSTVDRPQLNIEELFSSLPSRFKKEKSAGIQMKILFDFGNKKYLIKIENENITTEKTVDSGLSSVDLTIETDEQTYINVETEKLNPQEAFLNGKIKVSDLGKMMQFGTLFEKFNN
ncbi:MAG: acyl-CoA dehydrogenase [Bacteroidota bacterium]|nr:acyl-CoA dehydrogenase [Bacteroidota bacterium]